MAQNFLKSLKMHHVALRVSDFDKSKKFYLELGFEVDHEWVVVQEMDEQTNVNMVKRGFRMAILRLPGGGNLELFEDGYGALSEGYEHVAGAYFQYAFDMKCDEDVDAMYEHALSIGARPYVPPATYDLPSSPRKVLTHAGFVLGPDGEILEFLCPHYI